MNISLVFDAKTQYTFVLLICPARMILIDLQKAFGALDRDILLGKMKYLGFTSKTVDWFGSYLKKQNTVLSLEKTFSKTRNFDLWRGIPQGSILGLNTIFILYFFFLIIHIYNDIKIKLNK